MTSAINPQPLTFPRPIFAAVSPHPFLQAHLRSSTSSKPFRANGRLVTEFRPLGVNPGSLTHCNGSAVVRTGNTSVVCGVRAEILREEDIPGTQTYGAGAGATAGEKDGDEHMEGSEEQEEEEEEDDGAEIADLHLLVPNIELSTGSTPTTLPGNAPSSLAQTLISRINSLLHSTRLLRAKDLRITYTPSINPEDPYSAPETVVKGYWVLYIDIFFISLDGNPFDAAWLGILAALKSTKLPKAFYDEELEMILCSDSPSEAKPLRLRGLPVTCTFAVFEGQAQDDGEERKDWILSDPDAFEEAICRESVTVVLEKGGLMRVEKNGGGAVGRDEMKSLVKRSKERWAVWEAVLGKA
ncbi:exoribonuclease family protein [Pleomassaria siparia CBS 279.74]|uniref:Ribosomal RNA-processing protein 43 n=1 Tax=Pleomassaria siparia CBS 279.74 TaxID=1314801 RepID=A0A6G1KHV0_9PLEO|nr:exoribonuclease family protein [Pleomassaria siparia CBS 279.74]